MNSLDKAIEIACKAHAGQVDKAGQPYILHPLRLMLNFQKEEERIVAILHDVIEDSNLTIGDLKNYGFSELVVNAIDCISRRVNESYETFIERVSLNTLAKKIKIEDIKDNLDLTRIEKINKEDFDRVLKYHTALRVLLANS